MNTKMNRAVKIKAEIKTQFDNQLHTQQCYNQLHTQLCHGRLHTQLCHDQLHTQLYHYIYIYNIRIYIYISLCHEMGSRVDGLVCVRA